MWFGHTVYPTEFDDLVLLAWLTFFILLRYLNIYWMDYHEICYAHLWFPQGKLY